MKIKCKRILSAVLSAAVLFGTLPVFADTASKTVTITVGKSGEYDFKTVQEAVNSIKDTPTERNRAIIKIEPGTYNEEVTIDKPYISLVNSAKKGDVIITYDKANGHTDPSKNFGTDKTATVTVKENATGFKAKNITFVNSYNIDEPDTDVRKQVQAVALETLADKVVLEGCNVIARQDTLYLKGASKGQQVAGEANAARVYLKDCYIEGTVDFIFGDATAYFDSCRLYMAYYKNGGHFTAPNTTLYNVGYVFNNCKLSVDNKYTAEMAEKIDLGRPWQCDSAYPNYGSNSVFINCVMPEILNPKGFSLWDEGTVVNKVRFMEYGSMHPNRLKMDLSSRADYVKILTDEQAESYSAFNVLKGTDNWNPSEGSGNSEPLDITLNSYNISIPLREKFELKAYSLPLDCKAELSYSSSDESIASIDEKGIITALKTGSAVITVKNKLGFTTKANVTVTAARTAVPEIDSINITNESKLIVGQKLIANYSYILNSDNSIDAAKLRWCAVKGNTKIVLKEGAGDYYKSYTVTSEDIGYNIMLEVYPSSTTSYGVYGEPKSYTTQNTVQSKSGEKAAAYRTAFDNINDWTADGGWNIISANDNSFASAACEGDSPSFMKYSKGQSWDNYSLKGRFRFNPERKGLSADGYYNIYMNYNADGSSYYTLKLARGSNTKSLMLYLCKYENGEETLLASDTTSLKNNIYQNAGEDNPYFTLELSKDKNNIKAYFYIEGTSKYMAKLSAKDDQPLNSGTIAFEAGGDDNVVLMDSISVLQKASDEGTDHKTKLYLMGDSTAVAYGDDNTIGGWGEYLVNYFNDDVEIINKAEGGRSARSYLNQGRLNEVLDEVGEGDYVFIQFGTNDQRVDENAFMEHAVVLGEPDSEGIYPTIPAVKTKTPQYIYDFYKETDYPYGETFYPYESGTFKWYMLQHVSAIKKTGATPVLLTPMCRLFFNSEGKIEPHFGENDGYIEAVRQLAEEENVVCIDMYDITKKLYESYGIMTTQGLHNIKSDGTVDLTHYNKFGANIIASKMAEAIKSSPLTIRRAIVNSDVAVAKTDSLRSASLYVIGSTAAAGGDNENMAVESGGFGDYLQKYLSDKITVKNLALPDETVKSYTKTDEYKTFIENLSEGDYVILNFGENDGDYVKSLAEYSKYSYPSDNEGDIESFSYYLYNSYIKPAKEKKAVIIVTTPIAERSFIDGVFTNEANPYVDNVVAMVKKYSTFYVNLNNVTSDLYTAMGEEGSKVLNAYDRTGINNNTLSKFGAELTAKKFLTMMQQSSASLKDYINNERLTSSYPMTRADFVTMVMRVLNEDKNVYTNFDDVVKGKYYEEAVGAAKELGIVKAVVANNFMPESDLTGEFAIEVIKNALDYKNKTADMNDVYALLKGSVSSEIGIWAVDRLFEELN